ncbi:MAG: GNAT family N-acetyltransferase [Bacteroidetes bacterium]|nr:GNAT family N-acetyltransferase [Bacteroidota bacterium]MBS1685310.1 GNAT family N-acetyltransferase [Bacteroidota bacterium]
MIIRKYGLELVRLKESHIEMIRMWRNDPKIQRHMFFQATITPEMQRRWYDSVNNEQNYYFIIYNGQEPCGLISISSIDFETRNAFAGLFIYDDRYIGTDVPVRASLTILDVFFSFTNLESIYAKVRDSNLVAHLYNTSLGFKRTKKIELGQGYEYCLRRENYMQATALLHKATQQLYGNKTALEFDPQDPVDAELKKSFEASLVSLDMERLKGLEVI